MAITYNWVIPQMKAHFEAEGETNVIFTVNYIYTGSEESGGIVYYDNESGVENYTYTAGDPFVPYENTEAFEDVVIGWLEGSLDMALIQNNISANIQKQITPVNEDLYFTWMMASEEEE